MAKNSQPRAHQTRSQASRLILVIILILVIYVVLPQVGSFRSSFSLIGHAEPKWVALGAAAFAGTIALGAAIYKLLAKKYLPYGRTIVVLFAGSFASRLLPAGLGALGVGYRYLRRSGLAQSQALAVVSLNNLLGFIGNLLLIAVLLVLMPDGRQLFARPDVEVSEVVIASAAGLTIGLLVLLKIYGVRLRTVAQQTLVQLVSFRRRPVELSLALLLSMMLTASFSFCLWASARALGVELTVVQALLVLSVSVGVGALLPSPGGLGGAEAGLLAALAAYHIAAAPALAVALLYRLLTYWLGLVTGAVAFVWISNRKYI